MVVTETVVAGRVDMDAPVVAPPGEDTPENRYPLLDGPEAAPVTLGTPPVCVSPTFAAEAAAAADCNFIMSSTLYLEYSCNKYLKII